MRQLLNNFIRWESWTHHQSCLRISFCVECQLASLCCTRQLMMSELFLYTSPFSCKGWRFFSCRNIILVLSHYSDMIFPCLYGPFCPVEQDCCGVDPSHPSRLQQAGSFLLVQTHTRTSSAVNQSQSVFHLAVLFQPYGMWQSRKRSWLLWDSDSFCVIPQSPELHAEVIMKMADSNESKRKTHIEYVVLFLNLENVFLPADTCFWWTDTQ